jgi:hypothetical protein
VDSIIPVVRLLHIVFAVFWVGTVFFNVLILEPRLDALGPAIRRPVMREVMPRLIPAMIVSNLVVLATGVVLTFGTRTWSLTSILATNWGVTIAAGLVATVAAILVGIAGLTPTGIRLDRLGNQLEDGRPSPAQVALHSRLSRRMNLLSRVDFALVAFALATMPLARFV